MTVGELLREVVHRSGMSDTEDWFLQEVVCAEELGQCVSVSINHSDSLSAQISTNTAVTCWDDDDDDNKLRQYDNDDNNCSLCN